MRHAQAPCLSFNGSLAAKNFALALERMAALAREPG